MEIKEITITTDKGIIDLVQRGQENEVKEASDVSEVVKLLNKQEQDRRAFEDKLLAGIHALTVAYAGSVGINKKEAMEMLDEAVNTYITEIKTLTEENNNFKQQVFEAYDSRVEKITKVISELPKPVTEVQLIGITEQFKKVVAYALEEAIATFDDKLNNIIFHAEEPKQGLN